MELSKKVQTTGFVKLPTNYLETVRRAEQFTGVKINSFTLMKVLAHALPGLSDQQHRLLQFYLADMNLLDISDGECAVWKSSDFTQNSLGWSRSKVARIKAELRDLGLITVHYDMRNRPLEGQAITLAPFFADMPHHEAAIQEAFNARRLKYKQGQMEHEHIENECRGPKNETLIQTPQFYKKDTVPNGVANDSSSEEACAHKERHKPKPPIPVSKNTLHHKPSQWSSPKNQRNLVPKAAHTGALPNLTQSIRVNLVATLDISPKLKNLVDCDLASPALTSEKLYNSIHAAVGSIWPDCNTADHTFRWAVMRFGWRAIEILVVALEDPNILKPQQWFGAMATRQNEQFILAPNFKRIRSKRLSTERETVKISVPSVWKDLVPILGEKTVSNWYREVELIRDGAVLALKCPNEFYRHHISSQHREAIVKWAKSLPDTPAEGWNVQILVF